MTDQPSPEAPRVLLYGRDEVAVPLESYRGRLVFVNFWAVLAQREPNSRVGGVANSRVAVEGPG